MNVLDNVSTFSVLRLSASTCVCSNLCQCLPTGDVPSLDACRAADECLDHWFHVRHFGLTDFFSLNHQCSIKDAVCIFVRQYLVYNIFFSLNEQ